MAMLGQVASSHSLAAAPICQAEKVPMISPSSTNPRVTQVGDYIFRVCFIDPFQGAVMAKFAYDTLKVEEGRDPRRRAQRLLGRASRPSSARRSRSSAATIVARAVLQPGRHRLPRAADGDQGGQPRGDLRARLLHRGRDDRPPGPRARHHGAVPRRRRLGFAEALGDRRHGAERLLLLQPLRDRRPEPGRPEVRQRLQGASTASCPTRWPRSATTRPGSWPTR